MAGDNWQLIASLVSGVAMPALIYLLLRHNQIQATQYADIHLRIDHLDACIDDVKQRVIGNTISRTESAASLLQLREGVANDTKGLHDRIMRLEDNLFRSAGHDTRPR